ncbi:phytanoyl-CoA dioxygenase family protein [Desertibaculum subflavum]|uniref:phytanoyl-CoA dioxygenase family protein n=1 Tax=Desertibaculum subflavum TaxID=2268458 RepID=UPI000E66BE2E
MTDSLPRLLTPDQVDAYRRDGYLCPIDGLTAAEVAQLRADLEAFEAEQGRTLGAMPRQVRAKTHLLFPWMADLVRHPRILDAVEDLIGPDILVFHLTCWVKEPGDGAFVSWHQDGTYFHLDPAEHVTAWIGLSDSTPETGCVHVLPGSHRLGQIAHRTEANAANLLSNGQTVETAIDEAAKAPLIVRAGQFSLHHTYILHQSSPNLGRDRRIGIGISYIPTRVRHTGPRRLSASLVRGTDSFGHFEPEHRPRANFSVEARAHHAAMCDQFFGTHGSVRSSIAAA